MIRTAYYCSSCGKEENFKKDRFRLIFIQKEKINEGYAICPKCFKWFEKIGQLIINQIKK